MSPLERILSWVVATLFACCVWLVMALHHEHGQIQFLNQTIRGLQLVQYHKPPWAKANEQGNPESVKQLIRDMNRTNAAVLP